MPESPRPSRLDLEHPCPTPPLVIFASGGSGTRAVARLAESAGIEMGTNLNPYHDALELVMFFNAWIDWIIGQRWIERALASEAVALEAEPAPMARHFARAIEAHRTEMADPAARWGWKAPRGMFYLPYLHRRCAGLKVVHLVRDGRDMAFSANQGQLNRFGPLLLPAADRALPEPVRSVKLWALVNLAAARYGETQMAADYLRLRFEDLCAAPVASAERLLAFAGAPANAAAVASAAAVVEPPPSLGRWRERAPEDLRAVTEAGEPALSELGYSQS